MQIENMRTALVNYLLRYFIRSWILPKYRREPIVG